MTAREIDGHRIEELLGRGGMAEVYRARQLALDRPVALKLMHRELALDAESANRFALECRALAGLSSPQLVKIYGWGTCDGLPYFTMEIIEGPTLLEALNETGERRLSPRRALEVAAQLAVPLAVVHDAGLVHRDVKPGNVFLHAERGVVLADFGLVRDMSAARITQDGNTVGTSAYMAPEQFLGQPVSPATDVYALGVLLFELIAGRRPFAGATYSTVAMAHLAAPPPSVTELAPGAPRELDALLERMLAKSPADRPASVRDLRARLLELSAGLAPARPAPVAPPAERQRRTGSPRAVRARRPRHTGLIAAGLVGATVVAIGLEVSLRTRRAPPSIESPRNVESTPPEAVPLEFKEPHMFMVLDGTALDPAMFNKRRRADVTFTVRAAETVARAEVVLQVEGMDPVQAFEVRVNDRASVALAPPLPPGPLPPRRKPLPPTSLKHDVPPDFLVAGTNRLSIALANRTGQHSLETPLVARAQLLLYRR